MEFSDLSQYSYYQPKPFVDVFNVGWLGKGKPFPTGKPPNGFIKNLILAIESEDHIKISVNKIRSVHPCNICGEKNFKNIETKTPIGSSEIWIPRTDGGFFAAPSMIVHYIIDHHYLPPHSFISSVLGMDFDHVVDAQSEYARRAALAIKEASNKPDG